MDGMLLTKMEYDALKLELENLKNELPAVNEALRKARSLGDLSENPAYDEARAQREMVFDRMDMIRDLLKNAEILND